MAQPAPSVIRMMIAIGTVCLLGIAIISLHNVYIVGWPWEVYTREILPLKTGMGLVMITSFGAYAKYRLSSLPREQLWKRLERLPIEMFWAMTFFGTAASPLYHLIRLSVLTDFAKIDRTTAAKLAGNMLFDASLTLALSALLYTLLHRISRDYLYRIQLPTISPFNRSSFTRPMVKLMLALFLMVVLSVLWVTVEAISSGKTIHIPTLVGISAGGVLLSSTVFAVQAHDLRNQFRTITYGFRYMLQHNRDNLKEDIPIVSGDEIGMLTEALNELRSNILLEYDHLQQEAQLAGLVQKRLLPPSRQQYDNLEIAAFCEACGEVGGDFCDIVELPDGRIVIMIGDVSGKGMRAALVMAASIVWFRDQAKEGGSASEMLNKLNYFLVDMLPIDTYVTMGIAIFRPDAYSLEYASAGHLSPYRIHSGILISLDCSSLPLGIDRDTTYESQTLSLEQGDRFILYTDGIVETAEQGEILGFHGWEQVLGKQSRYLPPEQQIRSIIEQLPPVEGNAFADDRTLIIISCK